MTVNIVNGLADRGYDVELLLSTDAGELRTQLSDDVHLVELPPARTSVFGVAAHLPALVAYLHRRQPAALFPHLEHVSVVSIAAARVPAIDTTIVPTHHKAFGVTTDQTAKDRVVQQLTKRLYPAADQIVAVSQGIADSLIEQTPVQPGDVSVLHNPVESTSVREQSREPVDHDWIEDDDVPVVSFVGRHERQKDLETWLRAFARVRERVPEARAVIAGTGSRSEDLRTLAADLGTAEAVSMPGYVDNPYRYMYKSDVFLLSSRFEGLPTVLIEALACGCPIVATDCPCGPREILANGTYGRLVSVGDVEGLADAVLETLDDPHPPDVLRSRADEFSPESVLDDYDRFLEEHVV